MKIVNRHVRQIKNIILTLGVSAFFILSPSKSFGAGEATEVTLSAYNIMAQKQLPAINAGVEKVDGSITKLDGTVEKVFNQTESLNRIIKSTFGEEGAMGSIATVSPLSSLFQEGGEGGSTSGTVPFTQEAQKNGAQVNLTSGPQGTFFRSSQLYGDPSDMLGNVGASVNPALKRAAEKALAPTAAMEGFVQGWADLRNDPQTMKMIEQNMNQLGQKASSVKNANDFYALMAGSELLQTKIAYEAYKQQTLVNDMTVLGYANNTQEKRESVVKGVSGQNNETSLAATLLGIATGK